MAAATLTGKQRLNVAGHQRVVSYTSVAFAANGDTWQVKPLKTIMEISLTPTTNVSAGFTVSGNTITLVAAAGVTFRGSVYGL